MTPRRQRFVDAYCAGSNAADAARRAGFKRRNYAQYLLRQPAVAAAIERRAARHEQRCRVDADRVVAELALIAFSDIRRYVRWGEDGVALRPHDALPPGASAAIAAITPAAAGRGPSVRLHDKLRALKALARHVGLDLGRPQSDPAALLAETAELRAMLLDAAGIVEIEAQVEAGPAAAE